MLEPNQLFSGQSVSGPEGIDKIRPPCPETPPDTPDCYALWA